MSSRRSFSGRSGSDRDRTRARRARPVRGLCAVAALVLLPVPVHAEVSESALPSGIVVNVEVLNDLGRAAAAGPVAAARVAPALLPPPDEMPVSRLLVQPLPRVAGAPPARPRRKPLAALALPHAAAPTPEAAPPPGPAPAPDVTETPPAIPAPPPPSPGSGPDVAAMTHPPPVAPLVTPPVMPPAPVTPPVTPPAPEASAPEASAPETRPTAVPRQAPGATQSAALPPAGTAPAPDRFLFAPDSAELSDRVKRDLEILAARLRAEAGRRVQLLAYAGGETGNASRVRRLSLSRALAVRAFLVEKGIATGRIDVRALGGRYKEGPADRVDVVEARR